VRILLADDSVTAQNMGKKILGEAGHEVLTVSNGAAALKKINEERPDLIILDIYMPGYTGLEVCQRVKESREISRTPVLLTVGKLEPFKKEDARRVRAEAVVIKPFEASELMAAVNKIAEYVVAHPDEPKSKLSLKQKAALAQAAVPSEEAEAPEPPPMDIEAALIAPEQRESSKPGTETAAKPEHEVHGEEEIAPGSGRAQAATYDSAAPQPATAQRAATGAHSWDPHNHEPVAPAADYGRITNAGEAGDNRVSEYLARAVAAAAGEAFSPPPAQPLAAGANAPRDSQFQAKVSGQDVPAAQLPEFPVASAAAASHFPEPVPLVPTTIAQVASGLEVARQDPAFIADRTEELSSFPTHFGVKESVAQPEEEKVTSQDDEVAAALASLPGDESHPAATSAVGETWVEEVPVEQEETGLLLEDEMSQAEATKAGAASSNNPAEGLGAALAPLGRPIDLGPPIAGHSEDFRGHSTSVSPAKPGPAFPHASPVEFAVTSPAGRQNSLPASAVTSPAAFESMSAPIAARAMLNAADAAAVEDIVCRILDDLKPKLVAQILQELSTGRK
jgi:CheY-like chemotaxis protein